jgi:uncharacterized membrane protein HdeD (DUF308 family)
MLIERATGRWWSLVLRGLLAIAFGILAIALPGTAIMALVFVFGIFALADGFTTLGVLSQIPSRGKWLYVLEGIVSILAGLAALLWPGITAIALFYVIAWWALFIGVMEIAGAAAYGDEMTNEWPIILSGILWIVFGGILIIWPRVGAVTVLSLIATFAIIRGVALLVAGFRMRRVHSALTREPLNVSRR